MCVLVSNILCTGGGGVEGGGVGRREGEWEWGGGHQFAFVYFLSLHVANQ